jgi:peptidoglycan/LPS O-acetylase OafA/YrhL
MKNKTPALICIFLGTLSLLIAILKSNSWPWVIASLIIAGIALIFSFTQIVLKENTSKKKYYFIIILLGIAFLLFGLLK